VCIWPSTSLNWRPGSQVAIDKSAKCNLVWKPHAILWTAQVCLARTSKFVWVVSGPAGAKLDALRCCNTGEHNRTWCVSLGEVAFGTVICGIFDPSHNHLVWTWALSWLLWYACNYVRLILYIMQHSTNLEPNYQMHIIARSEVIVPCQIMAYSQLILHSQVQRNLRWIVHSQSAWLSLQSMRPRCSQVHSECVLKYTLVYALIDTCNCTQWHTPSLLDCTQQSTPLSTLWCTLPSILLRTLPVSLYGTPPVCLTGNLEVSSQDALEYHHEHALKYTPCCTQWYTPSLLGSTLPCTLSIGNTVPNSHDHILPHKVLFAQSID